MAYTRSVLCQLPGLSCVGCCGRDFGTKKEVADAIRQNTREYLKHKDKKSFMNRSEYLRDCGICRNVIELPGGKLGCPLHPALNGRDLREGHCDVQHLCKAALFFNQWAKNKQRAFLDFVAKKNLDWYDYSVKMDNNELLHEFEKVWR